MFVSLVQANIIEKLIQKIVELKSPKKEPLGKIGVKTVSKNKKVPS